MRAADLVEQIPTVTAATGALEAAELIARYRLSALIVADENGLPVAVIPGSQVLKLVVPRYVREDPTLAHAYDESGAEELCAELAGHTVGELLDDDDVRRVEVPSVKPDDTLVEIATVMVQAHSPLVVVRGKDGAYHGAITFSRTMAAIASAGGRESGSLRSRLNTDYLPADDDS